VNRAARHRRVSLEQMRFHQWSIVVALISLAACSDPGASASPDTTATMLHMADPRAAKQLTKGFYPFFGEGRWTERNFSAILKPPPTATRKGALLVLRFGLPETSINVLHTIQVSAAVNGLPLKPETFTKAGEFDYIRDVPNAAFNDSAVRVGAAHVDFALDKTMPPHDVETRELGIQVSIVGFEAK
jgi:hypothetical protein